MVHTGFNMLTKLNFIDIAIGNCNYWLEKAEDTKNLDSFNFWMAERSRLQRERAELLSEVHPDDSKVMSAPIVGSFGG